MKKNDLEKPEHGITSISCGNDFSKKQNYLNILYACTKQYHLIISMFNSPGMKVKDFTFLGKIHRIFSTSQSEVQSVAGGFSRAALNPCQWGPEL